MITPTAPSLVAKPRATLRTDAPSTTIARTNLAVADGQHGKMSIQQRLASSAGDSTFLSQSSRGKSTRCRVVDLGEVLLGRSRNDGVKAGERAKRTGLAIAGFV